MASRTMSGKATGGAAGAQDESATAPKIRHLAKNLSCGIALLASGLKYAVNFLGPQAGRGCSRRTRPVCHRAKRSIIRHCDSCHWARVCNEFTRAGKAVGAAASALDQSAIASNVDDLALQLLFRVRFSVMNLLGPGRRWGRRRARTTSPPSRQQSLCWICVSCLCARVCDGFTRARKTMGTAAGARDQSAVAGSSAGSACPQPYHRMAPNSAMRPPVSQRFTTSATRAPPAAGQTLRNQEKMRLCEMTTPLWVIGEDIYVCIES